MKSTLFFTYCISLSLSVAAQQSPAPLPGATQTHAKHAATWEPIREVDIERKRRAWGEIDNRLPENALFRSANISRPRNTALIDILIDGVMNGQFKAYDGKSDRFIPALSKEEFAILISPSFDASKITGFRFKEDSLLLRDKRSFVRMIGLAPLTPTKDASTGAISDQPMFWIYYPDAIKTLVQFNVSATSDRTWYDIFESGDFKANMGKLSDPYEWKVVTSEQKKMLKARGVDTTGLK